MTQGTKTEVEVNRRQDLRADRRLVDGCGAVALGVKLARTQVVCAYPITPSSSIVEKLSDECGSGRMDARFIEMDGEHSAMGALIGASQTGVRTFTATSSQGLTYMHEMLHWASGARLPIVLANANRALAAPWNIFCDHRDSMSQRDTGWMQLYVESCQEVVDTIVLAYRLAEAVLVPCMVCLDGFILSHTSEAIEIPSQQLVDTFLPALQMDLKLDPSDPRAFGAPLAKNTYMEVQSLLEQAHRSASALADEHAAQWKGLTGREWKRMVPYELDDAEIVVVSAGTLSGTVRHAVREMRRAGRSVGALSLRMLRPFPADLVRRAVRGRKVVVLDRACSYGSGGVIATELRSCCLELEERPQVYSIVVGLGGRDVTDADVVTLVDLAGSGRISTEVSEWYGLQEGYR